MSFDQTNYSESDDSLNNTNTNENINNNRDDNNENDPKRFSSDEQSNLTFQDYLNMIILVLAEAARIQFSLRYILGLYKIHSLFLEADSKKY